MPSRVAPVLFRNTCSTWVVATWELIFVSILMDLIGSARGSGIGYRAWDVRTAPARTRDDDSLGVGDQWPVQKASK